MKNLPVPTTIIIPAAGLGTRMAPFTDILPKELLPVVNIPAIQFSLVEAINAGFTRIVLVIRPGKELIVKYAKEYIEKNHKDVELLTCNQEEQLGLGHSVLCAEHLVPKGEPFGIILPDEVGDGNTLSVMVKDFIKNPCISKAYVSAAIVHGQNKKIYGMAFMQGKQIVELKEKPKENLNKYKRSLSGRYIATYDMFNFIKRNNKCLTSALKEYFGRLYWTNHRGLRLDLGTPHLYASSVHKYALKHIPRHRL